MVGRAVVAIINYQDQVLLGKKIKDPKKVLSEEWHVPGGAVEEGETDEEALIREMREETGLDIIVGRYIGSHITPTSKKLAKWYECFTHTDITQCGSDLDKVEWVPRHLVLDRCGHRVIQYWSKEVIEYLSS